MVASQGPILHTWPTQMLSLQIVLQHGSMHLNGAHHNHSNWFPADVKGVFVVEAEAAAQFMHDVSKANTAEAGLHLLAAVLGQPSATRDAVVATEANALQVNCPLTQPVPAAAFLGQACLAR